MSDTHEQLVIVAKYETFIAYTYPIAQNIPRKHGIAKELFLRAMLEQVQLLIVAGKTNQISRLRDADAGIAMLRYWLRFLSSEQAKVLTEHQHRVASVLLSEVGKLLGSWIKTHRGPRKE